MAAKTFRRERVLTYANYLLATKEGFSSFDQEEQFCKGGAAALHIALLTLKQQFGLLDEEIDHDIDSSHPAFHLIRAEDELLIALEHIKLASTYLHKAKSKSYFDLNELEERMNELLEKIQTEESN